MDNNNNYNKYSAARQKSENEKSDAPVREKVRRVTGEVRGGALNIRKAPSLDGEILCVVKDRSKLSINLDRSNGEWLKVLTPENVSGFCKKEFVEY